MELKDIANNVRIDIINQVYLAGSGHPGGSLSAVEIATLLYFEVMNIENFDDPNRDRFVLSKGHASPLLYAVLAQKGLIEPEALNTFRKIGSNLQGHPDMHKVDGVEISTGSLGLGISAATGMALAGKLDKRPYRVYVLLGDGELEEGIVWEALMAISHYKLNNITVIIDNNNLQIDGPISSVMSPYPIDKKLQAFGLYTQTVDGHSFTQLREALASAKNAFSPSAIIAKTIKGKGIDFMENNPSWHGKAPSDDEYSEALKQLGGRVNG